MIAIAAGFAEVGPEGAVLQERVRLAAWRANMPIIASGQGWISTFDINPLVLGPDGFAAVDGLCLLR